MKSTPPIELGIIGSVIRLGDACLSCPVYYGPSRTGPNIKAGRLRSVLPKAMGVLLVAGLVGAGLSAGWQAVVSRPGIVSGEGLFTVRQPANLEVTALTGQDEVEKGAVLLRYHSHERDAELAAMDLRCQSLEAEKRVLTQQALAIEPEIMERIVDLGREKRAIDNDLSVLFLERQHLAREALRDRLTREDALNGLRTQIDKAQDELKQARTALERARENYHRAITLQPRNAISGTDYLDLVSEFKSREVEVTKLEGQLRDLDKQRSELERARGNAAAVGQRHDESLSGLKTTLEAQLKEFDAGLKKLADERAADQARASRHRSELLRKLEIELDRAVGQRKALEATLQTVAPFAGRVVYRAPSPGSGLPGEPLLVVAPSDGLKFHARLPQWMKQALEQPGEVTTELLEGRQGKEEPRPLQTRFRARLAAWSDLPNHPGEGLAEFTCDLPAEAVRLVAAGKPVGARLAWQPPFYAAPMFMPSIVLAGLSGLALTVTKRKRRRINAGPPEMLAGSLPLHDCLPGKGGPWGTEALISPGLRVPLREAVPERDRSDQAPVPIGNTNVEITTL